jgi:hypothetical protein
MMTWMKMSESEWMRQMGSERDGGDGDWPWAQGREHEFLQWKGRARDQKRKLRPTGWK